MFDFLIAQILVFSGGICGILFSILAWRLRKAVFFYLGLGFLAIYLVYAAINYEYLLSIVYDENYILFILNLSFIILPIFFLIKSKQTINASSFDGSTSEGKVTDQYLDDIINAPEEEIDYD